MGNPREPAQPGPADSRRSEAGRDALLPLPGDRSTIRPRRPRKGIRSGRAPARTAHPDNADTSPLGTRHRAHLAAYCVWKRTLMAADRVFRIAVVLTSPSVVPAARGPVALIRSWSRVMAQGDEREPRPGRPDAAGAQGWVPGWPGCRPGAWRPRAIRGRGRTPARIIQRGLGPGTSRGAVLCGLGRRGAGGRGCLARPHLNPAVTLSDRGGRGERSPSRLNARSPAAAVESVQVADLDNLRALWSATRNASVR